MSCFILHTVFMRTCTFFKCDFIFIAECRPLKTLHIQKIQKASGIADQLCADLMDMSKYRYIVKITSISIMFIQLSQELLSRNYHPLLSNFLFTYLFSIKFLYFVIIKFHLFFAYFNLFVSIFIHFCNNSSYHVSILY